MSLEFTELHACIVTFRTFVRLLERVSVPNVPYEFPGCSERGVALLALLRTHARVGVDVVLQRRHCLEASVAYVALVRPFLQNTIFFGSVTKVRYVFQTTVFQAIICDKFELKYHPVTAKPF